MTERKKTQKPLWQNPVIIAASLATVGVVAFGWWAGSQQVCNVDFWGNRSCSGTKWSAFLEASPNEVGDTLAGFAGALAFVWLIATVVLQGQELREQRQEFEKMAEAQQEQVKVLEKQREIFEDEQRQRLEDRQSRLLMERLIGIQKLLTGTPQLKVEYELEDGSGRRSARSRAARREFNIGLSPSRERTEVDDAIERSLRQIDHGIVHILEQRPRGWTAVNFSYDTDKVGELGDLLEAILSSKEHLTEADQQKISTFKIQDLSLKLEEALALSELSQ
ncbi:hypothetical protein K3X48_01985 [Aliiroseovarius crassostreae]|uniref:Uncharacterized protein n=1 Tax=Aliiroseovarius crassostreae TaxID=154981 RepID=A0A9Q9HEJ0_9RHOB|nr:hypothetical protein [Aliiroseovarius crassostreae]UWP95797.1 hypothetical protein K3X48_01985 [Aliiroseovarius crassostreae]